MTYAIDQPAWLWAIPVAAAAAWLGARWFASMSRVRRWSAVVFRVVLVSLVVGMLAGASTVRRTDRLAVIGVIDVSGSVRLFGDTGTDETGARRDPIDAARRFFARALATRGPDDLFGLVVFDGESLAVATPTRTDPTDRPLEGAMVEGTDIAAALRYAAALIPPDAAGRIVLFSDGNQTAGDAEAAARELASRADGARGATALPVDILPVTYMVGAETMIEAFDAPPRAAPESPITLRVTLLSTQGASGTLRLTREGEIVDINGPQEGSGRRLTLSPGRTVEIINVELDTGRLHRFEAFFEPDRASAGAGSGDTRAENNTAQAFTVTPGRGAVLIVDGVGDAADPGPGATLAQTLRDGGLDVTLARPSSAPTSLLELQAFDLVVLQNVAADAVPEAFIAVLPDYVRRVGGGLLMTGGADSFGAGGWKGTPVEPLLPVTLDLPERMIQPDAAIVFVLDVSGSMRRPVMGTTLSQQEVANQAAALAVRSLDKKDLVGVVAFSDHHTVIVPLGPNTTPDVTAERILALSPGGGTNMGPGMEEAARQLAGVKATVRHIILVSDGRSLGYETLAERAGRIHREHGITLSTISVGDESDEQTMDKIAVQGGGTFYPVYNPTMLPRFFLKAVRIVRTPLIREGDFEPLLLPTGSPLTAGLEQPPSLGGLTLTQRRPEAAITYAMATPTGEPLLAHWNVELGRVAAFTSDTHRWAHRWIDWPGYRRFWTQAARLLSRTPGAGRFDLRAEVVGDALRLRLDAAGDDGRPLDLLTVPATVYSPGGRGGEPREVMLTQTAAGLYEGMVPARESGAYVALVTPRAGSTGLSPVIGGVSVATGVEYRRLQSDVGLLRRIAEATGGRVLSLDDPAGAALFDRAGIEPTEARSPLWRSLLLWALLVLLLDVATRRVAWDRFVSREFGVELRKIAAESVKDRGEQATRTVGRLRRGSERIAARPAIGQVAALGDADARRVAETAEENRIEAQLAAIRAARARYYGPHPDAGAPEPQLPSDGSQPPGPSEAAGATGEAGLLAAKRRAQERFDDPDTP